MPRFLVTIRRYLLLLMAACCISGVAHAGEREDFFMAIRMDNVHALGPMLAKGMDPNLTEPQRNDTGLILALREGSMQVVELLLSSPHIDIEALSRNGDNALMIAAWNNNRPAVEALLKKGAEVNRPGWTALHYAAAVGAEDIVQLLLDHSAYIDAASANGTTPLMMAARGGHIYTVKLLHDSGADATLKNALGMTAIDFAERNDHGDIVEGLKYRIARQEQIRKAREESRRAQLAREYAGFVRMLRQEDTPSACVVGLETSVFFRASARSATPSAASRGDPD